MTVQEFLDKIADKAVIDCNSHNLLPSPTLAQAIIESRYGTSTLATEGNNLFGIKATSAWSGKICTKKTKEYVNGQYVEVIANFRAYDTWNDSIEDHNLFLLNKRYANLIGVKDYKTYCNLIKQDGYATSPTYAQTLIDCIEKYNLQKYDVVVEEVPQEPIVEKVVKKFNIHAGHNPSGMVACGSIGYLNESDENRKVCAKVIDYLNKLGHTTHDCTCNDGTNQNDVLKKIVEKCNSNDVDLDISIHFNAISKEYISDGKTKGVEVWIHEGHRGDTQFEQQAQAICNSIADLGFTNRGVKYSDGLYFIKNTYAPAMLIECCFVDDADDFELYDCDKMAKTIVYGLTGENVDDIKETEEVKDTKDKYYTVVLGYYANEQGALQLKKRLEDYGYILDAEKDVMNRGVITSIQEIPKEYLK